MNAIPLLPRRLSAGLVATLLAGAAQAHVTLDQSTLPADSYVRVAVRVPHGCEGAATTGLRLQIPAELRDARPMPLAGWTLSVLAPETAASPAAHGASALPREVAWQGGNLPDNQYQEFVLRIRTPAEPGATLYFPVVQECEGGRVTRWIERPSRPGESLRAPAHAVRILPKG